MDPGLVAGVVLIGVVHGILPDHGWPIAATYALNRSATWVSGTVAALILGVGHLISSVVLVLAYFWLSEFAAFADGPWMGYLAGTVLILLGIREYRHGSHTDHGHHHHHDEPDHGHDHDHRHAGGSDPGVLSRLRDRMFGNGGHQHLSEAHAERGLVALGTTALLLGFAHEEPVQILAICAGTPFCIELMLVYSLAVIVAILVPTLVLIAGYERHRETVESYTPYLPLVTASVLVGMGIAFLVGIF